MAFWMCICFDRKLRKNDPTYWDMSGMDQLQDLYDEMTLFLECKNKNY
jgi:hypothetical protein